MQKSLSRLWLLLGVAALAIAGLFSLVLVVARTPALAKLPFFADFFHKALVVHVDLSVLVWFLCFACLMWSLAVQGSKSFLPYLEEAALIACGLGTLALTFSPLDPNGKALMSNYIPVITTPIFFVGLALCMCGVALMILKLFTTKWSGNLPKPLRFMLHVSGLIALMSLAAFMWSHMQIQPNDDAQAYYEILFWGGGHVLQFLHTQILMVCWLLLAWALKPSWSIPNVLLNALAAIALGVIAFVPIVYMHTTVESSAHRQFFTNAMIVAGGIAPVILAALLLPVLLRGKTESRALWSSLAASVFLFLYGGALGGFIQGQNVVIPAHYHGSIVGVTLAFMGTSYLLLPRFGYRDVSAWRSAYWQPIVYGGGQLLHISALAWSGGYGVLRKTPGGFEGLSPDVKAALGVMGLGGVIAIIGGLMFVVVVWRAAKKA